MYYEERIINGILHCRGTPNGTFEVKGGAIANVINLLSALTDDERKRAFGYFCNHCGSNNPKCHCSNDE